MKFFPIEAGYKVVDNKTVVELFGVDESGKKVVVLDHNFTPYFWVSSENLDSAKEFLADQTFSLRNDSFSIKSFEVHEKTFNNETKKFLKVFVNAPYFVPVVRDAISSKYLCLEADIIFTRRYFIDKGLIPFSCYNLTGEVVDSGDYKCKVFNVKDFTPVEKSLEDLRVLAFDIETYNTDGLLPEASKDPIIMISLVGNDFKKVITWKSFDNPGDDIVIVNDEKEMMLKFVELVDEFSPDVLSGYFTDGFDFPYLEDRAKVLKIKLPIGIDSSPVKISKTKYKISEVRGICHFDVLNFVRRVLRFSLKTPVYDLNSVSKELLGEGKVDIDILQAFKMWDEGGDSLKTLCEYNLKDSALVFNLVSKVLPNAIELCKVIGLPLFDTSRFSFSQLVEWYLLRIAFSKNILAPNRPDYNTVSSRKKENFEGAFVFEPKTGLHKDIVVFDFRSLYPSIISSHNISPETIDIPCDESDKIFFPDNNKKWVCKSKQGFISGVIEEIVKKRSEVKELIKKSPSVFLDSRSLALKTLANSIYGYLAFDNARWYSNDCAGLTTSLGRQYIKNVSSSAEKKGFSVVYGDTDSIFLTFSGMSKDDVFSFVEEVNKDLPGIMELEFEGLYSKGIFVGAKGDKESGAKKKYALLRDDGSLKITGFEAIRRNLSIISKEVQTEVLNIVLKEGRS